MFKNKSALLLTIVFILSFLIRFIGLGFSHFYGDETKIFYLDKTVPAFTFFMDQRKGPIQFIVVWIIEKFINGHDELITRIPFALAGFLSVIAFYYLAKKLFNNNTIIALLSTILFSFNGFNIAFSRTIQYQSFLTFFGLLAVYLFMNKKYLLSAMFLGLSVLSHYDGLFFLIPLLYLVLNDKSIKIKEVLIKFLLPLILLVSLFYVPYFATGYFKDNTFNYVLKRFNGDTTFSRNYSFFTFNFYNPYYVFFIFFVLPILLLAMNFPISKLLGKEEKSINIIRMLNLWFLIPFVLFQFFMSNPGTHIHNYFIPFYLLIGFTIYGIYHYIKNTYLKTFYSIFITLSFVFLIGTLFYIFIPQFNSGYPWNVAKYSAIHSKYQLFIYGFPYYRNWEEIRIYFKTLDSRVEGVFTNDGDTIAQYYLRDFNYTRPGSNFYPQYYIDIKNNQEFVDYKGYGSITKEEFYSNYTEVKRFDNAVVYKRIDRKTPLVMNQ